MAAQMTSGGVPNDLLANFNVRAAPLLLFETTPPEADLRSSPSSTLTGPHVRTEASPCQFLARQPTDTSISPNSTAPVSLSSCASCSLGATSSSPCADLLVLPPPSSPILNYGIYPVLRRHKMMPSAVVRMAIGMFLGALTMVVAAILQWQVYTQSPCGRMATTCDVVTPISLWVQIPLFSLPAMGEIMVNVTVYELAITAAPQRMKGLTYSAMLCGSVPPPFASRSLSPDH